MDKPEYWYGCVWMSEAGNPFAVFSHRQEREDDDRKWQVTRNEAGDVIKLERVES